MARVTGRRQVLDVERPPDVEGDRDDVIEHQRLARMQRSALVAAVDRLDARLTLHRRPYADSAPD